ncbi:MAG: SusC/RagA family TonB-linked outer membrane protein, partial [Bacteroidales bacterium]|nr:SusC/RagA family TonB-linked outer membrane protein [Bacteroidales bacterium]
GNIMGRNYLFTDDGQRIVGASGRYDRTTDTEPLGNVMPDWTGGINNSFTYKNINLSFLIDIRKGGQFFSTSYMWGMYSGMIEKTVENNIREDGIVLDGVMEDPNNPGTYITNTIVCDAANYGLAHYYVHAMDVFDADYIKLRELTLGYTLPNSMLKKVPFSNIRISFVARNLFTWGTAVKGIDPDFATNAGNIQGIEGAQVPSTRSFGFNLSFNL